MTKCPPTQKLSLAHRRRRITLTSIHYRGRYALRVTQSPSAVTHLNYLLRQQSENAYLMSKNRWILQFLALFLYFLIFSILTSFVGVWRSISMSWLDFLPGAVPKSIWAGISSLFRFSCSYSVHVLFSATCFFDSKNGSQAMKVVQTDPRYS